MRIGITGHRPNKLWGYDYDNAKWQELKQLISSILKQYLYDGPVEFFTGMALGVDTVACLAALELKEAGENIEVIAEVPCQNQDCKWPATSQRMYKQLLDRCDRVNLVSDKPYAPYLMQLRNQHMVDQLDLLIAVWDGTTGGTHNCVKYALSKDLNIIVIDPANLNRGGF